MKIYLASSSPRRRELLTQIGIEFQLLPASVDESPVDGETGEQYVRRIAQLKARCAEPQRVADWPILAADTCVINDGFLLGKPQHKADALQMLQGLSGKVHQVKTAICVIYRQNLQVCVVNTDVEFRCLTLAEIEAYWQTGEPCDKAGAYGIQGLAGKFVKSIHGSYSSVVGLPLLETEQLLSVMMSTSNP